jgi:hypothetical protein
MIRLTEIELREPDFNKFTALARGHEPTASLSGATAGDLDRSLRQREVRRPSGFADELRAVLPGTTGTWARSPCSARRGARTSRPLRCASWRHWPGPWRTASGGRR